uniref:Dynein axonemal intermediate chain 4 n=1 Tax=Menidia menidia TaxID=238744 RepID=A0A8S4BK39_9TELE|nr:unnamed protein product [Menidia menidia]CAG5955483.1 unnamed protein product [Menidia menidia]
MVGEELEQQTRQTSFKDCRSGYADNTGACQYYRRHVVMPYEKQKINIVKKQVTEDMLKEYVEIFITETDTILLLDMYPTFVSVEVDNAESLIERNHWYTGICKTRTKNAKYVDRSMQTLNFATKSKQLQSYNTVMVEAATTVSYCDIHHSSEEDGKTNRPEIDYAEAILDANKSAERSLSVGSTSTYVSTSNSQKEVDVFKNWINNELDLNFILLSEKFQHSLLVMERNVLWNIFQYQLAAYRQFSLLKEPDGFKHPQQVEQEHGDKEVCQSPALECLWIFSCELCRGYCISSMGWNKKNPWPEHIIQCESAVTSLDFSATCPSQLAVGMYDGSIAIYDLQSPNNNDCPNKHFGPVWQLRWNKQELNLIGEEKEETLFSVGADGRITKWFVLNGGLDCIDLMKLDKISNTKRKSGGNKTKETRKKILSAVTPGLCFDFHPTDYSNYLTGTWEGLIHRCSCSNSQQSLETYQKHFSAVNCVVWCPLHPGMFLSCGADWTIHLWHQDRLNPIICFTSAHRAVCDIKWSPQKATVFGVAYEGQLEIWDLSSNLLDPVIIEPAAPGVKMTSLMFASETDCIVVGDSDGHVTVYQIKNLGVGKRSQMDVLDNLLRSAFST